MEKTGLRGRSNPLDRVLSAKRFGMEVRLNKFSDEQFLQPRICAEASQILLIAEQNLKFCSLPHRKALRNGGKNEEIFDQDICDDLSLCGASLYSTLPLY